MDAPAAGEIYAKEFQAAQAEANAIAVSNRAPSVTAMNSPASDREIPRVEINSAATGRVQNAVAAIDAAQQSLLPSLNNAGAEVIFRTQRAFNGIAVRVNPDGIAALAALPGVKSVRALQAQERTSFSDINFLGTQGFWNKVNPNGVGIHGENIKIAIIDTGLDYVHSNFGGPGTTPGTQGISDTSPVPNAFFPTAKIPFGTDLAGDAYDGNNTPKPDPNPLDSNGHGTATASLAAGFGVNFGGSTYVGNYDNTTPFGPLKISPGFAPRAQIIPIRVFGTNGSTRLTVQAIDYALDPRRDGSFRDRPDVLSSSLGSNNGSADDASAVAYSNAAAAGIIVVNSAGNANDTYYITGSGGTGSGVMSVAASYNDQAGFISDLTLRVNRPSNLAGSQAFAKYGSPSPRAAEGTSANVVEARPRDGSTAFTNANQIRGNVALIDRGAVSFVTKVQNAQAAGAVAAVIVNNVAGDPITMSLDSSVVIPAAMISLNDGNNFRGSALFDPATGVPLNGANVTAFNGTTVITRTGVSADTMPTYSSRGPRLGDTALKPDITAPAQEVGVALVNSGTDVGFFNGTSSSCPHVAGGMALMKQLHPTWTNDELMALAMNTATHDLFVESGTAGSSPPTKTRRGVSRVGAGRIDLNNASNGNVVIFNSTDQRLVSVSFGNVEVPVDGTVGLTKNITIRNKGDASVTYNGVIDNVNTVGDANFSAPSSRVRVDPGQSVTFPVLFRATGSTLKHTKDASVTSTQGTVNGNISRQYLSEAGAYAVLTPCASQSDGSCINQTGPEPVIRIPLYAAVKPVSAMRTTPSAVTPISDGYQQTISLSGAGINTGPATPVDILSLAKPMELQFTSNGATRPDAPSNPNIIKNVGISSDYASRANGRKQDTRISFAIDGFGNASVPSFISSDKEINIDINGDGITDFVIFLDSRRIGSTTQSNVYTPVLLNVAENTTTLLGNFTNGFSGASLDTNSFNNSVVVVTVPAALLGYTGAGQSNFNYSVVTFNSDTGAFVDGTPTLKYDIAKPGIDAATANGGAQLEPLFFADLPGQLMVDFNGPNFRANNSQGLMMVHMHNGAGNHSDVVTFRKPSITGFTPASGRIGTVVSIQGTDFSPSTSVRFSNNVPATDVRVLSPNTVQATVPAGTVTGPITVSNPAGESTSAQAFTVTAAPAPTPSPTASPTGRSASYLRQASGSEN